VIDKEKVMKEFAVYQLPESNPKIRDMYFMKSHEIEAMSDEYEFVAAVKANTLDEVFRIGNFVVEEDRNSIAIMGEMHSISVGDIIQNVYTGETWVVAPYGFDPIDMKESV
jgi:hypothetical protein